MITSDTSVIWEEFAAPLRAFVARRVPPGIEPDDVIQEVFVRVLRHLPALRETERIEGWLYQVARNALHDAMRTRQRRDLRTHTLDEIDSVMEVDAEAARAAELELAPCLAGMVARLPEPYRAAIELTTEGGLTQSDAAKQVGISLSGMKSRVQRGRQHLKQMLVQCCEVEIDRRGGVADYRPRQPGSCGRRDDSSGCVQFTLAAST